MYSTINNKKIILVILIAGILAVPVLGFGAEEAVSHDAIEIAMETGDIHADNSSGGHDSDLVKVFFFMAVMLIFARIGMLAKKINQPPVLGELLMGIVLSAIAFIPIFGGINLLKNNDFIFAIAEIGVILLLFRTGLETNLRDMAKVGARALAVAVIGVIVPFVGGYWISSLILPAKMIIAGLELSTYMFIGATLTATSVGITARVFSDLNFGKSKESKIVLGAAVVDDILGLIILAVVSGVVAAAIAGGTISATALGALSFKLALIAFSFIAGAILFGRLIASKLSKFFAKISTGVEMKMTIALLFCFGIAYGSSELAGLAPIVGAFAAGLLLDPVHFNSFSPPPIVSKIRQWRSCVSDPKVGKEMEDTMTHEDHFHVEDLVDKIAILFVPVFFVYTGMQVDLHVFGNFQILWIALIITVVAFIGKIVSGAVAGKNIDKKIVGLGMVPRGEVGLIFANEGKKLGVITDEIFAVVVIVVILTTLLTPIALNYFIRKKKVSS